MFVTVIPCKKCLKTNQISHSRWWVSHQGWMANKEDYYNAHDQNKEIGNELCILVGINPELLQFLNLRVDFLLKYTMFDHLHWWLIFFSIRTCSIRYKYQSSSTIFDINREPVPAAIAYWHVFHFCLFQPRMEKRHSRSLGRRSSVSTIKILSFWTGRSGQTV